MKRIGLLIVAALAVAFAASCTTFKLEGAQVTREIPAYNTVGTFSTSVHVSEFLGAPGGANLLNVTATAMDTAIYDAIQREIQKYSGDAAVNITIEYKASVIDYLLNAVTFSLYAPATAEISGTIVKYTK